jgi:hypothetical protein
VRLRVERSSGYPNRFILSPSRAIGMLIDLVLSAVVKHGLSHISTDQGLVQKAEEPCEREPFEVLVDGRLFTEFGGQGPPRGTVEHLITKGVEVLVHGGRPTAYGHNVVASNLGFFDTIFNPITERNLHEPVSASHKNLIWDLQCNHLNVT